MVLESRLGMTEGLLQQVKPCVEVAKLIESTSIKFTNSQRFNGGFDSKIGLEIDCGWPSRINELQLDEEK